MDKETLTHTLSSLSAVWAISDVLNAILPSFMLILQVSQGTDVKIIRYITVALCSPCMRECFLQRPNLESKQLNKGIRRFQSVKLQKMRDMEENGELFDVSRICVDQ